MHAMVAVFIERLHFGIAYALRQSRWRSARIEGAEGFS